MRAKVHIDIQLLDENGHVVCDDHMDRIDETQELYGVRSHNAVVHELVFAWHYIMNAELMHMYRNGGDEK